MWPMVNGIAYGNPDKVVFCLGSDGSQMEGNDAEAARLAVSESLNVKLIIDDNDVTITGHPSEYMKGYSVQKTLAGHGLATAEVKAEGGQAEAASIPHPTSPFPPSPLPPHPITIFVSPHRLKASPMYPQDGWPTTPPLF